MLSFAAHIGLTSADVSPRQTGWLGAHCTEVKLAHALEHTVFAPIGRIIVHLHLLRGHHRSSQKANCGEGSDM